MTQGEKEILNKLISYINSHGGVYSEWYSGITSDPQQRLFVEHNVSRENGHWVYHNAGRDHSARNIVSALINNYGTDGGSGWGNASTTNVYAYRKTAGTNP